VADHASRYWSQLPTTAARLLVVELVSNVGTGLVLPFLAIYVGRAHGFGPAIGSITVAAFAAGCLVSNTAAGRLADRHGARVVLQAGWCVAAVAEIGLVASGRVATLLVAATATGLGVGAAYPSFKALLGALTSAAQRRLVFGTQHGLLNVGLSVGTLAAAVLIGPGTVTRFQFLYVRHAASFLLAAALLRFVPSDRPSAHAESAIPAEVVSSATTPASPTASYRDVLADRTFRRVCLLQAPLVVFGYAQYHAALPIVLSRPGAMRPADIALVFAVNTVIVAGLAIPVAVGTRAVARSRLLVAGGLCFALCWLLLASTSPLGGSGPAVALAAVAAAVMGIGETLLSPSLGPLANDLASPQLRGRYNSIDALVLSLGSIAGPGLTALLFGTGSISVFLVTLAAGCLDAVAVALGRTMRQISG
jgi:MFS family permease